MNETKKVECEPTNHSFALSPGFTHGEDSSKSVPAKIYCQKCGKVIVI